MNNGFEFLNECNFSDYEKKVVVDFYNKFVEFSKIPHKTFQEEKASLWLYDWFNSRGFITKRDSKGNIIVDIPATKGLENLPVCVIQSHMDMVCVFDNADFDPAEKGVQVYIENGIMKAKHSSLGADDAMGIVIFQMIAENIIEHGPLRGIITVEEEEGMGGANALDSRYLDNINYMINIDSSDIDKATVSCPAGCVSKYSKIIKKHEIGNDYNLKITINGIKGGHSGLDIINKGANANIVLCQMLKESYNNIGDFRIVSFDGGKVSNAITTKAETIITASKEILMEIAQYVNSIFIGIKESYTKTDPDMCCDIEVIEGHKNCVGFDDSKALIDFVTGFNNGIYSMFEEFDNTVESSSNTGLVQANPEQFVVLTMIRSANKEAFNEIKDEQLEVAKEYGFDCDQQNSNGIWEYNRNSKLINLFKEKYKEITGNEFQVYVTHGCVECGVFSSKNKDIDIISIGLDLDNVHTVFESCSLSTVPLLLELIKRVLVNL